MLEIKNVGPFDDPDPWGERNYELRDIHGLIVTFKHRRSDGLAKCLQAAAAAVERKNWMGLAERFKPAADTPPPPTYHLPSESPRE